MIYSRLFCIKSTAVRRTAIPGSPWHTSAAPMVEAPLLHMYHMFAMGSTGLTFTIASIWQTLALYIQYPTYWCELSAVYSIPITWLVACPEVKFGNRFLDFLHLISCNCSDCSISQVDSHPFITEFVFLLYDFLVGFSFLYQILLFISPYWAPHPSQATKFWFSTCPQLWQNPA